MGAIIGDSVASPLIWAITIFVAVAVFTVDLAIIGRRPHEPSMKEVSTHLAIFVSMAIVFGVCLFIFAEPHELSPSPGLEFFSGWLLEYSLSIDNLFIFIIIMANFNVPREYQQKVLMIGIVLALVMRAIFIVLGAAAINQYSWVFYIFGLFLVWTAYKLAKEGAEDEDDEYEENRLVKFAENHLPATSEWHGTKFFSIENGKRLITPMFLVVLTLGTTDLLFALDSIPAIYGVTKDPYLVFTANVFALMGLRQLYFLIGGLLQRLIYLSYGLAFLLLFIGVKLVLHAMHENELPFINGGEHIKWAPDVPIWLSLVVIIGTLAITAIASLAVSRKMSDEETDARTGPRRDWEND
ncbi:MULTISPECIES: TerC family protein [unclassified Nocardioides]|uniref:TerC family protein n=1 Tax=unclassified Nocardioides TaxID=2615069 RepID=UPI000B09F448|nr:MULTISPECIES: TerC family protein [unclassified Nocardioides]